MEEEIEVLRAIYPEIEVELAEKEPFIRKTIYPTAEEGSCFASVLLTCHFPSQYPHDAVRAVFSSPRGLSEESLSRLRYQANQLLDEHQKEGNVVVFDLIEMIQDFLANNQLSDTELCYICYAPLSTCKVEKMNCDHHLHSSCYNSFVISERVNLAEKLSKAPNEFERSQIPRSFRCPLCNDVIIEELEPIKPKEPKSPYSARPSVQTAINSDFDFDWTSYRQKQAELQLIYEKQKERGGIIDIDEERKKKIYTLTDDLASMDIRTEEATEDATSTVPPLLEVSEQPSSLPPPPVEQKLPPRNHQRHRRPRKPRSEAGPNRVEESISSSSHTVAGLPQEVPATTVEGQKPPARRRPHWHRRKPNNPQPSAPVPRQVT